MDDLLKVVFGSIALLFFSFGYIFRHKISYIVCPLEKYTGKIYKGKAHYFMTAHLILSVGLCILCFNFLYDNKFVSTLFNDSLIRISSFFLLWFVWLFFVGLLIEEYLIKTDEEYKIWKEDFLKKKTDS